MAPFFSVVIPTYNRREFLEKCLDSVLPQTFGDFEVIIVDDGSDDATGQFLSGLDDARIRYVRQENKGPASARNWGIVESCAAWICFLDSDDLWDKRKLAITSQYIQQHPHERIFHTQEIWLRKGKHLNQKKIHKKYNGWIFEKCLPLCCVGMSTVCMHRSVFEAVGLFDEDFSCCEDYELWLRVALKYPFCLIDEALTVKTGGHEDQLSKKYWGMDRFRVQALVKLLRAGDLSGQQYQECLKELKKKCYVLAAGCVKRGKSEEAAQWQSALAEFD